MSRFLIALALSMALAAAAVAAAPSVPELRLAATSDPHGVILRVRAALDAGDYAGNPTGEREALWWMGHAGINAADDTAVTESVARLRSLYTVGHDTLARSYAGFLTADLRIAHGDAGGVSDALQAAALQLDSTDPRRRALAEFQLCDAYSMTSQFQRSQPLCQRAATAFGTLHAGWDQAQAKNDEGNNATGLGQYAAARTYYEAARTLYANAGDHALWLSVGDNLAQVYLKEGHPRRAIALSRASLADERASGRIPDALISQYDIARALEAMGRHREAMALTAATVDAARQAKLGGLLPDLLQQQSHLAERNGQLKLALSAAREARQAAQAHWSSLLDSQQAKLAARYASREKEIRIQELERNNQIKSLKLQAAEADAARNEAQVRRQRSTVTAALVAAGGLALGLVSLLLLVRSDRRYARELRRQALEDPLTGVDNRRGFFQRVERLLAKRGARGAPLHALLLFDFDFFKSINDRCGHPYGDIVLNVSLKHVREVTGARGHVARLGGEEFVVVCPYLGGEAALKLADDLRGAVAALAFPNAPDDLVVTISIGVALFDGIRCHDTGSWLRAADDAMYTAKARGRDQVAVAQEVGQILQHASVAAAAPPADPSRA